MAIMISHTLGILLISIIVTVSVTPVIGCTCQLRHPQQSYCDASFVFQGNVLGKSPFQSPESMPGQYEYQIHVQRVFKDTVHGGIPRKVKLVTPALEALCGSTRLMTNKVYLFTGKVVGGQLELSVCDWVAEWKSVTRPQRQGIKHVYKKYCSNCMIQVNAPSSLSHPLPHGPLDYFHGCAYTSYTHLGIMDCEVSYASCVQHANGGCNWLSKTGYQECTERRKLELQQATESQKTGFKPYHSRI